jgi:hypothetical protein
VDLSQNSIGLVRHNKIQQLAIIIRAAHLW